MSLGRAVVVALAALGIVTGTASAAAPVAVDDTPLGDATASPTIAIDVLANDSDPDGFTNLTRHSS